MGALRRCLTPLAILGSAVVALALVLGAGCGGDGGGGGGSGGAGGGGRSTGGSTGTAPPPATGTVQPFALGHAGFQALVAAAPTFSPADRQATFAAFVAAQAATLEGFPLRSGASVIFVHRATSGGAFAVAGSWNGWSPGALPLAPIAGTDILWAEATLPAAARHEYKFVENGTRWLADPQNRKFSYDNGNSVVNLAGSGRSHLERLRGVRATRLANTRDIYVYLPPGALDGGGPYPVVYMHDGQNLFDPLAPYGSWEVDSTVDRLIANGEIRDLVVVGIPNMGISRFEEYTHTTEDISTGCSGSIRGGDAADYADFIVSDLKPRIDVLYPTLPGREATAILGSSLGGLVSIWIAFAHPNVFENTGGMSSTFWWGSKCLSNPTMIDIVRARGKQDLRIYIDAGGSGASQPAGDNWGVTEEMKLLLEAQGYRHGVDLFHWWEPGAAHNEAEWAARLEMPLKFWFPR